MDKRQEELLLYLDQLAAPAVLRSDAAGYQAKAILENPQALIDALVEAGVLETATNTGRIDLDMFRLVETHVHEWRVMCLYPVEDELGVQCDCGAAKIHVPNKLPIEVPNG